MASLPEMLASTVLDNIMPELLLLRTVTYISSPTLFKGLALFYNLPSQVPLEKYASANLCLAPDGDIYLLTAAFL